MSESLRQYELVALLELLIARLQQPRFNDLAGAADLVLDMQRVHGELMTEICAGTR